MNANTNCPKKFGNRKKKSTQTVKFECLMLELLGRFEPPTSSLPSDFLNFF